MYMSVLISVQHICLYLLPNVFMDLMSRVFQQYLVQFVIVFVNNTLVYSRNVQQLEEEQKLRTLLKTLREEKPNIQKV